MTTSPGNSGSSCCCSSVRPPSGSSGKEDAAWNRRYFSFVAVGAVLWWGVYSHLAPVAHWIVSRLPGLDPGSRLGASVEFFLYDSVKILLLVVALIYCIAWARASLNTDRVRDFLTGKRRGAGYFFGAAFGAVTPFCSCSSIPLFLGFTTARIPIGITMAFLITSPLINEIAVVLLWGLLGWKFTVAYVAVGIAAGVIGGILMDGLKAGRWLQPFILESINNTPVYRDLLPMGKAAPLGIRRRHAFAYGETAAIFKKIWLWVLVGVGIGAALHGYVPANWFAENLGAGEWWSVPAAVLVGIPLYSSVSGVVPVMESLLVKGMPIGTTMAFCMSAVAASIPEVMMLRRIMTLKLQAIFIGYLWVMFTLVGWLFNAFGPYLFHRG